VTIFCTQFIPHLQLPQLADCYCVVPLSSLRRLLQSYKCIWKAVFLLGLQELPPFSLFCLRLLFSVLCMFGDRYYCKDPFREWTLLLGSCWLNTPRGSVVFFSIPLPLSTWPNYLLGIEDLSVSHLSSSIGLAMRICDGELFNCGDLLSSNWGEDELLFTALAFSFCCSF